MWWAEEKVKRAVELSRREVLTEKEVAELLSVTPSTVLAWRHKGVFEEGVDFFRLDGRVFYLRRAVEKLLGGPFPEGAALFTPREFAALFKPEGGVRRGDAVRTLEAVKVRLRVREDGRNISRFVVSERFLRFIRELLGEAPPPLRKERGRGRAAPVEAAARKG